MLESFGGLTSIKIMDIYKCYIVVSFTPHSLLP